MYGPINWQPGMRIRRVGMIAGPGGIWREQSVAIGVLLLLLLLIVIVMVVCIVVVVAPQESLLLLVR